MHQSNSTSTEPLKQLLLQVPKKNNNINNTSGKNKDYNNNNSSLSSSVLYLSISNLCKDIIHIGASAEEYYHVELICNEDNGIKYVIQAYGEQAKELYKEINRFDTTTPSRYFYKEAEELVEKDNKRQQEEEEQEKFMLVKKAIDCITNYNFNNGCLLIFKKLKNVCISKRKIMFD
jgi:hypothetical protein